MLVIGDARPGYSTTFDCHHFIGEPVHVYKSGKRCISGVTIDILPRGTRVCTSPHGQLRSSPPHIARNRCISLTFPHCVGCVNPPLRDAVRSDISIKANTATLEDPQRISRFLIESRNRWKTRKSTWEWFIEWRLRAAGTAATVRERHSMDHGIEWGLADPPADLHRMLLPNIMSTFRLLASPLGVRRVRKEFGPVPQRSDKTLITIRSIRSSSS